MDGQRSPDASLISALTAEHVTVRALLADAATAYDAGTLEHAAEALRGGRALLTDGLDEHIRSEDDVLFPALADELGEGLVAVFIAEHRQIEQLRDELVAGLDAAPRVDTFRELAGLLEAHTRREDDVLFPAARDALARRSEPSDAR